MAYLDIKIIGPQPTARRGDVQDRTSSGSTGTLKVGEPIKKSGNYYVRCADGEPTNAAPMAGIVSVESTETATADGVVEFFPVVAGVTVMRARATTPANIDTAAELLGVKGDSICFDLSSSTFTIDEDEGDDPNVHGLLVIGGDIAKGTLDFVAKGYAVETTSSY